MYPEQMTETNNYWTTKLNNATNRRIEKLESEGVKINTSTHEGRKVIGYNYLELVKDWILINSIHYIINNNDWNC